MQAPWQVMRVVNAAGHPRHNLAVRLFFRPFFSFLLVFFFVFAKPSGFRQARHRSLQIILMRLHTATESGPQSWLLAFRKDHDQDQDQEQDLCSHRPQPHHVNKNYEKLSRQRVAKFHISMHLKIIYGKREGMNRWRG